MKNSFLRTMLAKEGGERKQRQILDTMLRVVMEQRENITYELLHVISDLFGKCTLSVMDNDTREVLVSTLDGDMTVVSKISQGLREPYERRRYLRSHKNGIWFRENYHYICTFPLRYGGGAQYTLLVEQEEDRCKPADSIISILSMAVQLEMADKKALEERHKDLVTGLPNRDALLDEVKQGFSYTYIGMFCLANEEKLLFQYGYDTVEKLTGCIAGILKKAFPDNVYRMGADKFAVFFQDDSYVCAAQAQDCMELLLNDIPQAECCAVLVSKNADSSIYKILYACEHACNEAVRDTVSVIRGVGSFDTRNYREDVFVSGNWKEEDIELDMEAVYEKADFAEKVVTESTVDEGEAEQVLNHFFNVPEEEELLEHV